jgi:hypothetical protein
MICQDAGFTAGNCRIEVHRRDVPDGAAGFVARMFLIDERESQLRPVVFADGSRAEIPGETEQLAINNALAWLSNRFGALTEYTHACFELASDSKYGAPVVVD